MTIEQLQQFQEHRAKALALLHHPAGSRQVATLIAEAQVHATLAQACAAADVADQIKALTAAVDAIKEPRFER